MSNLSSRPVSSEERDAFQAARVVMLERMPYLAAAAFALKPVAVPGLGTFACDQFWRVYMDPDLLVGRGSWSFDDVVSGVAHEIGHLLRDHAGRSVEAGVLASEADLWNTAGDAPINDDLRDGGFVLLDSDVTAASLGFAQGETTEFYFDQLRSRRARSKPQSGAGQQGAGQQGAGQPGQSGAGQPGQSGAGQPGQSGAGQPGQSGQSGAGQKGDQPDATRGPGTGGDGRSCGSGAGQEPGSYELPADHPLSAVDNLKGETIRNATAAAIAEHTTKSRGSVPAGLDRWAAQRLAPPQVSWQKVLRSTVRRGVCRKAGQVDYSYARPSRRTGGGDMAMPSLRSPQPRVAVVFDTSGSMGEADLRAAAAEVHGVSKQLGIRGTDLMMVQVDAAVAAIVPVFDIRRIRVKGGGGTDMRVGIRAVTEMRHKPDVCVVATDCDTPWPTEPIPGLRVVVAAIGHDNIETARSRHRIPDWMTVVAVPASKRAV